MRRRTSLIIALSVVVVSALVTMVSLRDDDGWRGEVTGSAPPPSPSAESTAEDDSAALAHVHVHAADGGCAAIFDNEPAHFDERAILVALEGCRGAPSMAAPGKKRVVESTLPSGSDDLVDDAGLGASLVARVRVEADPEASCDDASGVIALIGIADRRLDVAALGAWRGACSPPEFELAPFGSETVLLEDVHVELPAGPNEPVRSAERKRVWLRRDSRLIVAGDMTVSLDPEGDEHDELDASMNAMTADLEHVGRGFVAEEAWTASGSADPTVRRVKRTYTLEGDRLRSAPPWPSLGALR